MPSESVTARPSAVEWMRRLAEGSMTSRRLVEETLTAVRAADGRLHAVVAYADDALAAAEAADVARSAGDTRPLLGLPVSIKDALDVMGIPTTSGSMARHGAAPATTDATVVERLRSAGAIPLLKSNVPELCSNYETDNVVHGRTNHPLDPDRTPGGSSGGEGALLGADASVVGVGTDGGGSIRVPSHYVGTVGLRPTTGRVPETGFWPATRTTGMRDVSCVGPMGRYVEDLALLLPIISGSDGRDPYAVDRELGDWRRCDVSQLRVGWYDLHPAAPTTTPGTMRAVQLAAKEFTRLGCQVERIAHPVHGSRLATELFFAVSSVDGGRQVGLDVAAARGIHHPQFQALMDGSGEPLGDAERERLFDEVEAYRVAVRAQFDPYDVVLSPVVAGPAPKHGEPPAGIAVEEYLGYRAFEYCHVVAMAGLPAVSVPVLTEDRMPVGIQVIARPWREDVALAAAAHLEGTFGGFQINRRISAS